MVRKIFRYLLLIINSLLVLWLLICVYAAYFDSSKGASILSLMGFTLIFALLSNFAFIFIWLIFGKQKKKFFAFISLIAIIISWPVSKAVIGFHPGGIDVKPAEGKIAEKKLKIMTYNVHLFDLGGWTKDNTTQRKLVDFIQEQSPDILCLQEFYMDQKDPKQPFTEIISNLGYPYMEFTKQSNYEKNRITRQAAADERVSVGIAVFSKYPLEKKKDVELAGINYYRLLSTDVKINDSFSFKLIAAHLQSFSLGNQERVFIEKMKEPSELNKSNQSKTKSLLKKLMLANQVRASQANDIAKIIKENKEKPLIICGDFNDIPGSYVYNTIQSQLSDPFVSKGFGLGRTFSGIFPTLRIDHIFYNDKYMKALSYEIIRQNLSDHFPVTVEFALHTKI